MACSLNVRSLMAALCISFGLLCSTATARAAEPTCTVNPQPVGTTIAVTYSGLKTSGLGPHAHYLSTLFAMDLLDELGNPLPLTYEELQTRVIVPGAAEQTVFFKDEGDGRFDAGLLLVKGDGKANSELSTHCFAIVA